MFKLTAAALAACMLVMPARAQDLPDGAAVFAAACAGCHGESARGDGPLADVLTIDVPDLTRLAAQHDGVFPRFSVLHVVDGRTGLRGHGGPMPVFGLLMTGDTVAADGPDGTPVFVSARVLAVVEWLAAQQQ